MEESIKKYFKIFKSLLDNIAVTDCKSNKLDLNQGIAQACSLVNNKSRAGNKVLFIGNGASAAIASHMAVDFWKNGRIKAMAFNDSSLLTCISNDFGYEHVFEKPLEMFADKGDILFAISSSGKSKNILNAAKVARRKHCNVITLSGFNTDNPLNLMGDINFYVPAKEYGFVEAMHQLICHSILDIIMDKK